MKMFSCSSVFLTVTVLIMTSFICHTHSVPVIKDITNSSTIISSSFINYTTLPPNPTKVSSHTITQNTTLTRRPEVSTTTKRQFSKQSEMPIDVSTTPRTMPECFCGVSPVEEDGGESLRVIGATIAANHSFPWQAALRYYNQLICSATVINQRYLLTAAHCIMMMQNLQRKLEEKHGDKINKVTDGSLNMNQVSVVLGTNSRTPHEAEEMRVSKYLIHPHHTVDELHDTNDIALIQLARHIQFNKNIKPVCLPTKDEQFNGKLGVIVGWGRTEFNGSHSQHLRQATVYIFSDSVCKKSRIGKHFSEDPRAMICAYKPKTDACQGDSGGPLLYKSPLGSFIQVGVVSWGIKCAEEGYPGVYAEVSSYIDWIHENTQDALYCS